MLFFFGPFLPIVVAVRGGFKDISLFNVLYRLKEPSIGASLRVSCDIGKPMSWRVCRGARILSFERCLPLRSLWLGWSEGFHGGSGRFCISLLNSFSALDGSLSFFVFILLFYDEAPLFFDFVKVPLLFFDVHQFTISNLHVQDHIIQLFIFNLEIFLKLFPILASFYNIFKNLEVVEMGLVFGETSFELLVLRVIRVDFLNHDGFY